MPKCALVWVLHVRQRLMNSVRNLTTFLTCISRLLVRIMHEPRHVYATRDTSGMVLYLHVASAAYRVLRQHTNSDEQCVDKYIEYTLCIDDIRVHIQYMPKNLNRSTCTIR